MLENLRRKSLTVHYYSSRKDFFLKMEQGHVIYLDSFSIAQHKQRISKEETEKSFSSTFDSVSKKFRVFPSTLDRVIFDMILCPSGAFIMGHRDEDDNQPRKETIKRPFLLGETEVTQELYQAVMEGTPSKFQNQKPNPVENVSWRDAILFCNSLSWLQGLDVCYTRSSDEEYDWVCDFSKNGYRLPTEKEWEYAAKAGTQNLWSGTDNIAELHEYAWFGEDGGSTHPVKTKKPNGWGFYDMSGNVYEWCWDKYDPKNPKISAGRVRRGGSWRSDASVLFSATRYNSSPSLRLDALGFRVCRSIVN